MAKALSAIPDLPRVALVEHWTEAYGRPPPKGISRRLLEYAAAYHLQAKVYGNLKPAVRRQLARFAEPVAAEDAPRPARAGGANSPPPGSRLVREWHGRSYTVEVLESGFLCDGRRYRSLSEIARTITGTRWSGPAFFGTRRSG